ncbi:YggT family protein [Nitrosospira sp. NpAV]|uniref:YggT family protein n=1 Tax=Nitrosospira sp. NpAV TaxID=58133 RepID=UPI00059FD688|nr:YggT family protein [Nitrosospira sp. NpAV]KIO50301.1 integral membrane protein YggT, involved in response to extracytoplasmic stress (osmotic shock) [Nitrosospira sp. NpAV]
MLNQILIFLLDTLLGLFSLALLLRFYMQLLRAPYRNPLSQFLVALTDFIVRPARRIIPGYSGIDLSTLLLAWLAQCMLLTGMLMLQGYEFRSNIGIAITGLALLGLMEIIKMTLYIILVAVIMQAVLSWFNPHTPLAPTLDSFTRPFLGIIRRRIPPIGNVDLSPLFVLVIIQLLLFVVAGTAKEISLLF